MVYKPGGDGISPRDLTIRTAKNGYILDTEDGEYLARTKDEFLEALIESLNLSFAPDASSGRNGRGAGAAQGSAAPPLPPPEPPSTAPRRNRKYEPVKHPVCGHTFKPWEVDACSECNTSFCSECGAHRCP